MSSRLTQEKIASTEALMAQQLQTMADQASIRLRQVSWANEKIHSNDEMHLLIMQLDTGIIEAEFSDDMLIDANKDAQSLQRCLDELIRTLQHNS